MNIIAFGASSSQNSINKQFATYTANQFEGSRTILDLNDFPLPLYSVDIENELGIPDNAKKLLNQMQSADLLIISLAEHNGTYTVAFKNLFDWISRLELKLFQNKKMLLISTSPGGRGGLGVMEAALIRFPIHGAEILGHFSLPKFHEHFNVQLGITNETLKHDFDTLIEQVKSKI